MAQEIGVSLEPLLDDQLSVKHDKAAEHHQSQVEMDVEDGHGAEEEVCEGEQHQHTETGAEETGEVEVGPAVGEERHSREAGEDAGGSEEGGGNKGRINTQSPFDQRSQE